MNSLFLVSAFIVFLFLVCVTVSFNDFKVFHLTYCSFSLSWPWLLFAVYCDSGVYSSVVFFAFSLISEL